MRLLVCGGAGFIGSNFIHYILEAYPDYKIINLDKLTYAGNLDNLKDISDNPNYTFVQGDITDLDKLINKQDLVLIDVGRTILNLGRFNQDNYFEQPPLYKYLEKEKIE